MLKPTQRKRPLIVRIRVYELLTKELIRNHRCDFGSDDTRRWLSQLVLWATQNGKGIEIVRDEKAAASANKA